MKSCAWASSNGFMKMSALLNLVRFYSIILINREKSVPNITAFPVCRFYHVRQIVWWCKFDYICYHIKDFTYPAKAEQKSETECECAYVQFSRWYFSNRIHRYEIHYIKRIQLFLEVCTFLDNTEKPKGWLQPLLCGVRFVKSSR